MREAGAPLDLALPDQTTASAGVGEDEEVVTAGRLHRTAQEMIAGGGTTRKETEIEVKKGEGNIIAPRHLEVAVCRRRVRRQ